MIEIDTVEMVRTINIAGGMGGTVAVAASVAPATAALILDDPSTLLPVRRSEQGKRARRRFLGVHAKHIQRKRCYMCIYIYMNNA